MRKADLKPGVVYGTARSIYSLPEPIAVLAEPADKQLWQHSSHHPATDATDVLASAGHARPTYCKSSAKRPMRGTWSAKDSGYAVARLKRSWNESHQKTTPAALRALETYTLEQFSKSTTRYPEVNVRLPGEARVEVVRLQLDVLTSLTQIKGVYAELLADAEARDDAETAYRKQKDENRERARQVQTDLAVKFKALGIEPSFSVKDYGDVPLEVKLDAKDAAWLAMCATRYRGVQGYERYTTQHENASQRFRHDLGLDL